VSVPLDSLQSAVRTSETNPFACDAEVLPACVRWSRSRRALSPAVKGRRAGAVPRSRRSPRRCAVPTELGHGVLGAQPAAAAGAGDRTSRRHISLRAPSAVCGGSSEFAARQHFLARSGKTERQNDATMLPTEGVTLGALLLADNRSTAVCARLSPGVYPTWLEERR
jgi:hypothetical protein